MIITSNIEGREYPDKVREKEALPCVTGFLFRGYFL